MSDRPASPVGPITARRERRGERKVLASFGVTMLTGFLLLILYAMGGQTQLEGILLALCLGGLGVGIVLWAQELMSGELRIEERHAIGSGEAEVQAVEDALIDEEGFTPPAGAPARAGRRARRARVGARRSPSCRWAPRREARLFQTPWKLGLRLVDGVRPGRPRGGHPAGRRAHASSPRGSSAAPRPRRCSSTPVPTASSCHRRLLRSRLTGSSPCPRCAPTPAARSASTAPRQGQLICPCHQSTFDVLHGAVPVFGPAARPLPQLPIQRDGDGFIALGDFPEPIGPSFWNIDLGPVVIGDGGATPAPTSASGLSGSSGGTAG